MKQRARVGGPFVFPKVLCEPSCGIALKTRLKTEAVLPRLSKEQIAARIAVLQAKLDEEDGGVYEDPATGRWFIVMRPPGATKTTTRRRAPDGRRLRTRDEALIARGQWEAQMASGEVVVGREHFEAYWPRYPRHAKADMTQGSWDDVRAHGSKRLLPFFNGMQMSHPTPPAVSSDARPGAAVAGDEALHI